MLWRLRLLVSRLYGLSGYSEWFSWQGRSGLVLR